MAAQRPWIYSVNTFLHVTDGSYRLSVRISDFHLNRLKTKAGDPVYDAMIARFEPLHEELLNAYNAWKEQGGTQLGQTLGFTNLLLLLSSTKIGRWDIVIQNIYDDKTQQYKTLLPKGRAQFQHGSQTDILSAVKVLSEATAKDPKLANLSEEVTQFYNDLQKAFDNQKQSIGNKAASSGNVEKARIAMCTGQFANLGGIIQATPSDPDTIAYFFDQLAIREGTQVLFTGSSLPQKAKNILVHTYAAGDHMKLESEGMVEQWFYLAPQKDGKPGDKVVKVPAGETMTVAAEDLGDLANRYLMVYNPDTDIKGEWTVEFV